jgi:hypothetical protein
MEYVHVSPRVHRRIERLKQADKAGKSLAQKASRIIEGIASGDIRHDMDAARIYTKFGEKRIKNCRKYDLGSGYRLIALQRRSDLFVSFLGTHDECQRWLERNSRLKEVFVGNGAPVPISNKVEPFASPPNDLPVNLEEDDEDAFLTQLTDSDLRCVFCGLVEAAKKRTL